MHNAHQLDLLCDVDWGEVGLQEDTQRLNTDTWEAKVLNHKISSVNCRLRLLVIWSMWNSSAYSLDSSVGYKQDEWLYAGISACELVFWLW